MDCCCACCNSVYFNPRSPHGERPASPRPWRWNSHFNPRSPHGERRRLSDHPAQAADFNPRSPHGERRASFQRGINDKLFQSTLPARGATDGISKFAPPNDISIHAPRTGSDHPSYYCPTRRRHFNPRSPHGERQTKRKGKKSKQHFNPRSPHGERHLAFVHLLLFLQISIHAPRTGSDAQATHTVAASRHISIHAPRTGSDAAHRRTRRKPPAFQSTLPARGATRFTV